MCYCHRLPFMDNLSSDILHPTIHLQQGQFVDGTYACGHSPRKLVLFYISVEKNKAEGQSVTLYIYTRMVGLTAILTNHTLTPCIKNTCCTVL